MRKIVLTLMVLGIFVLSTTFGTALSSTGENMTVKANILQSRISLSVPNEVTFQDIAAGYLSERQDLDIENTGTVDIEVTPQLENSSDKIFSNLAFQKVLSDPMTKINWFSFDVAKPLTVGGTNPANIYMYLDLQNYKQDINSDMLNHEGKVIFWAVPA